MNHATETARRYLDSWNAADATERRRLLAQLWIDDGRYADPMMSASGVGAIDDVATLSDDGRLQSVIGFIDQAPGS